MNPAHFFAAVASVTLYDPLAAMLGAARDGLIEYGYGDAVKLAGHSCPTVAGAYLMTLKALTRLYPETTPERGALRVELRGAQGDGVSGVVASIASLITGAASEGGFKGIAGRFSRQNLLRFAAPIASDLRVTRLDTGAAVAVAYHPEIVPAPPALQALLPRVLAGEASDAERAEFGRLWQARVRTLLIDACDDPRLVVVT